MKLKKSIGYVIILPVLVGVSWLVTRPPVLEIKPAAKFGFERAIVKCELKNRSLVPINVLKPVFSQTIWFRVVGPDGKQIEGSVVTDSALNEDDIIVLEPGGKYGLEMDLRGRVCVDTKFRELSKDVSEKVKEEYKKSILWSQSARLFDISVPGKYKVQAYYYIDKDNKSMFGKQIWTGKIKSNTLEVVFENKSGAPVE